MKKIVVVLLCLMLVLSACGQNRYGEISNRAMSDEPEFTLVKVSRPATKVIFQLHNPTDIPYYFGWEYQFEALKDGVWYETDYAGTYDVPAELLVLDPGSTLERTFYTADEAVFRPGTYRVVIEFWKETEQGGFEKDIFSCGEFTVEY